MKKRKRKRGTFIAPWQEELQQHSLCGAPNGQVYYSAQQFHYESNQEDGQQEKAMTENTHIVLFNYDTYLRKIGVRVSFEYVFCEDVLLWSIAHGVKGGILWIVWITSNILMSRSLNCMLCFTSMHTRTNMHAISMGMVDILKSHTLPVRLFMSFVESHRYEMKT